VYHSKRRADGERVVLSGLEPRKSFSKYWVSNPGGKALAENQISREEVTLIFFFSATSTFCPPTNPFNSLLPRARRLTCLQKQTKQIPPEYPHLILVDIFFNQETN